MPEGETDASFFRGSTVPSDSLRQGRASANSPGRLCGRANDRSARRARHRPPLHRCRIPGAREHQSCTYVWAHHSGHRIRADVAPGRPGVHLSRPVREVRPGGGKSPLRPAALRRRYVDLRRTAWSRRGRSATGYVLDSLLAAPEVARSTLATPTPTHPAATDLLPDLYDRQGVREQLHQLELHCRPPCSSPWTAATAPTCGPPSPT